MNANFEILRRYSFESYFDQIKCSIILFLGAFSAAAEAFVRRFHENLFVKCYLVFIRWTVFWDSITLLSLSLGYIVMRIEYTYSIWISIRQNACDTWKMVRKWDIDQFTSFSRALFLELQVTIARKLRRIQKSCILVFRRRFLRGTRARRLGEKNLKPCICTHCV